MQPPPPKTHRLAIAALVCALVFCVPLLPMIGVVLGVIALTQISRSQGRLAGQGLAIAAIAIGSITMIMSVGVLAAIAIPNFVRYQLRAKTSEARANLGGIIVAQRSHHEEAGRFLSVRAEGSGGALPVDWSAFPCPETCTGGAEEGCTFACLGWSPFGPARYRYACSAAPGAVTCAASADLDSDGEEGVFVFAHREPNAEEAAPVPQVPGAERCPASLPTGVIFECAPGAH